MGNQELDKRRTGSKVTINEVVRSKEIENKVSFICDPTCKRNVCKIRRNCSKPPENVVINTRLIPVTKSKSNQKPEPKKDLNPEKPANTELFLPVEVKDSKCSRRSPCNVCDETRECHRKKYCVIL